MSHAHSGQSPTKLKPLYNIVSKLKMMLQEVKGGPKIQTEGRFFSSRYIVKEQFGFFFYFLGMLNINQLCDLCFLFVKRYESKVVHLVRL